MTRSPRRFLAWFAAFVLSLALLGAWSWWARPTLDGLDRLLAAGQFQAAERQLLGYLRAYPGDESARMLLARASVDRPDPKPELAIEQLEGLEPASSRRSAQVRSIRGEAYFLQRRYDRAESIWLDALKLDPSIAEVGWGLLNLYALEHRHDESRRLALQLHAHEPDPHDRLQLLLQMIRFDAHAIEIGSLVHQLEPVVAANPADLASSLALGTAYVQVGRAAEGLGLLGKLARQHPDRPEPSIHLAEAFAQTGQADELDKLIAKLPPPTRDSPRIITARAWLAMQRQDWSRAADLYLEAFAKRPGDPAIAYRLKTALHHAGRDDQLAGLGPRLQAAVGLNDKIRPFYDRIDAGTGPDPVVPSGADKASGKGAPADDYRQLAAILRQVGRVEEADLWDRQAAAGGPLAP